MGKALVKHNIEALRDNGVDEIYLVTNYLEEKFEQEFGERTDVSIVHQDEVSGTASAIREVDFIEDDFLVVNGDVLVSEGDLEALLSKHDSDESIVTLLGTDESKPEKFGVLSITNDDVVDIREKPEAPENNLINTGIYVLTPEIFQELENLGEEDSLTDAVKSLAEEEEVKYELVEDHWIDINSPEKLCEADKIKREFEIEETEISEDANVSENAEITGKAIVEDGAEIKPGTVIEGRVYIGEDTVIGPNTVLSHATIGRENQVREATVDEGLTFEKCIVDPYTHLENFCLAEESNVKSGTVIRESFIGARSFIEMNNSIYGKKFVPDARTDL
ncbi:MAG: sugar phosphate nucleotidyltransferase, partial [Candidatus Nanohalobium sp.]